MTWDPGQYLRFGGERARPWRDLLAAVRAGSPGHVVDLGCGPGTLTVGLAARWPGAQVTGVDSSAAMVARARREAAHPAVRYVEADAATWQPQHPVDVVVSNAALHWVPGHLALLPQLVGFLAPGGELAVQVPANFAAPTHELLREVVASPRWSGRIASAQLGQVAEPEEYLDVLAGCGCAVDVWQTVYLHVLPGKDPVLEWMRGAALRPVLALLTEAEQEEFCAEYGALLRRAYPPRAAGTVLPYRRTFAVARRDGARG